MRRRIPIQKENIFFFLFNFFFFASQSFYFGFTIVYLTSNGYSQMACNVINTLICVVSFLFQPVAGYLSDTFIPIKKYLILAAGASIVATFLLPMTVHIPVLAAASIMLMSITELPIASLADTWVVTLREKIGVLDYGKIRCGGSIGFSITSLAAGYLIAQFGYNVLFIGNVLALALVILFTLLLPEVKCANRKETEKSADRASFGESVSILLKNKLYMMFLISSGILFIAMRPVYNNIPFKLMQMGGAVDQQNGIALAVIGASEIPVLFIINRLVKKYKLSYLYLGSAFCLIARIVLLFSSNQFSVLLLSQVFHSFCYSSYIAISLEYISRVVPLRIRTTAIAFAGAVTTGLCAVAGTFGGAALLERIGYDRMAQVMGVVSIAAFLLFLIPMLVMRKKGVEQLV